MKNKNFGDFNYYDNRELSWLKFNNRVFNEAKDKSLPIMERVKFVSITASNLDEFFMVRVASLKDMVHAGYEKPDLSGRTPKQQLEDINVKTRELVESVYNTYNRSLVPLMEQEGVVVYDSVDNLDNNQLEFINQYFNEQVYPVLTPMALDASRPFPLIRNKSLNIAALIEKSDKEDDVEFVTVQVPSVLPRYVNIPGEDDNKTYFILLENIIENNIDKLFLNYKIKNTCAYRVMRNADFSIDEEEAEDLLSEIEKQIKKRQWGEVIRLEVSSGVSKKLLGILKENLMVDEADVYKISGPIDLTFLMKLSFTPGFEKLRLPSYTPVENYRIKPGESIFDEIKKGDILLFHPYETFDPVVDFISQAASDPSVLAIKQTLYRVSGNSPIIASLAKAAENGKQVTVLVELKARFDEENNIIWARKLEKAGCHVIYGLVGLKTHCKIALVVRREEEGIVRYVHLGTGNYNDSTAKLYTDNGMFTCKESYGADATAVFNMLSGYSQPPSWNKLAVAPIWLRDRFEYLIDREIKNAKDGKEAYIVAKMNSLCDKDIIEKLYEASCAGVQIYLVIRGICCLKAGIVGVSDNIHVSSIVGTFLEHSRIFYFYNNGAEDIYMASADWMPRNLDRRVEIMFPVEDDEIKDMLKHILDVLCHDNLKAYYMDSEANYSKADKRGKALVGAQDTFMEEYKALGKKEKTDWKGRRFIPIMGNDI